ENKCFQLILHDKPRLYDQSCSALRALSGLTWVAQPAELSVRSAHFASSRALDQIFAANPMVPAIWPPVLRPENMAPVSTSATSLTPVRTTPSPPARLPRSNRPSPDPAAHPKPGPSPSGPLLSSASAPVAPEGTQRSARQKK